MISLILLVGELVPAFIGPVIPSPPTMSANILAVMGSVDIDMLAPTDEAGPSFVYFVLLVTSGFILDTVEVNKDNSVALYTMP